jgi:enamine deaminase RidA (YjgF/YER057c/UK114 family)
MFLNAEGALIQHGYTFQDVKRTWIYLQHILDWYGDFNAVRNTFFSERNVGQDRERSFPASTGIQGVTDREECIMDVLAVAGPGVVTVPMHETKRQKSADDYGSAFSRAMSVHLGGLDLVFVSGTASIDPAGNSIFLDDGPGQVLETYRCLADLLELRGAGLEDIHLATLFAKTPDLMQIHHDTVAEEGLPALPLVPTVADVCRDDLLVEIEAVAVVPL